MSMPDKEFKFVEKMRKKEALFTETVDTLSDEDLSKNLLLYSKQREEVALALADSEEIEQLEEQLKELKAPYKESLQILKNKIKYIAILLKDKGSLGNK